MSYVDVMRAIGSKTPTVRQNYITNRLFRQISELDGVEPSLVEKRFSVLFLSIREHGVQRFLGIDPVAEPAAAQAPVPEERSDNLRWFTVWVFGTDEVDALFTDSRKMGSFSKVLDNPEAVEYLQTARRPTFAAALERAGTDHEEVLDRLNSAIDEVELALSTVHLFAQQREVHQAVLRLALGIRSLVSSFPDAAELLAMPEPARDR